MRWRGILLTVAALGSTGWLAVTGRLDLYVNPRYIAFTVVLALVALVALVIGTAVRRPDAEGAEPPGRAGRLAGIVVTVLCGTLAAAMVLLPPATLSSATATARQVAAPAAASSDVQDDDLQTGSTASFSVKDWAALLGQTSDASFWTGRTADVIGFVTPDSDDPDDVFYVTRFVVTCCAVDAQPVGVPVYSPGWASDGIAADDWVEVEGAFGVDPGASAAAIVLVPTAVTPTEQPDDPYLY
ncbi:MAG: TIGR03943 family protein [Microbacteriaceae bacterium]